jgi:hypothetical protein
MPLTTCDMPVSDVDEHLAEVAAAVNPIWWGTVEYCQLFPQASFSPQRLYIKFNSEGSIRCAYCYRERKIYAFRAIDVLGPLQSSVLDLDPLLHRAHMAVIHYARSKDLEQFRLYRERARVRSQGADVVLDLPDTFEEYIQRLGQSTRKNMKYYVRRLEREWGSDLRVVSYVRSDIPLELVFKLVAFNRARLQSKGKKSTWTDESAKMAWRLSQRKGVLCGVFRGDHLVAGVLSYLHLGDAYFILIGHDLQYDELQLGKIALWFHIQSLIGQKIGKFYMHYGHNPYKLFLGGQSDPVYEVTIFRNQLVRIAWTAAHGFGTNVRYANQILERALGCLPSGKPKAMGG